MGKNFLLFGIVFFSCVGFVGSARADVYDDSYAVSTDGDQTERGHKAAVYHNNYVYTVSRYYSWWWTTGQKGDYIGCARFGTDSSGRMADFKRMEWVANPSKDSGLSGNDVNAAVYNGNIYVVYDYINPENNQERFLYYKYSSDPEKGWSNNGGIRISEAKTLSPGYGTGTPSMTIGTAVLNDKLHVFYTNKNCDHLYSVAYDGKDWTTGPDFCTSSSIFGSVISIDAQSVLTDTNKAVIAIFCSGDKGYGVATFDGSQYHLPSSLFSTSSRYEYLRCAFGTSSCSTYTGAARNVLNLLTHELWAEVTLPGDTGADGTMTNHTSGVYINSDNYLGFVPVVNYVSDSSKNLQQYISIYSFLGTSGTASLLRSDYYQHLSSHEVNTADESYNLSSAWSLIGVIEGVPPFALNNNKPGSAGESSVSYGASTTSTVSTSSSFGLNMSLGGEASYEGFSVGLNVSQGFKWVRDYDTTITSSVNFKWDNSGSNGDGSKGFMLIQKPTLVVDNYTKYAADKTTSLGPVDFTTTSNVSLEYDVYSLSSPPDGMKARPISSNYQGWYLSDPPTANVVESINALSAVHGVGSTTSSLDLAKSESVRSDSSTTVKVSASLKIFQASGDVSLDYSSTNSTKLSQNISATLTLADPPEGEERPVDRISVTPYWLSASKEISNAYWIPSSHKGCTPWCLTWSVISLTPTPSPVTRTSTKLDFNGDGIQDILTYVPVESGSMTLSSGEVYLLSAKGKTITRYDLNVPKGTNRSLVGSGKFGSSSQSSLVWYDSSAAAIDISLTQDSKVGDAFAIKGAVLSTSDQFAACGDFIPSNDSDEILLRNPSSGLLVVCSLDIYSKSVSDFDAIYTDSSPNWSFEAKGDFDGNGCCDVLVRNSSTSEHKIIYVKERDSNDSIVSSVTSVLGELKVGKTIYAGTGFTAIGAGDFNGDGVCDILLRQTDGQTLLVALMSGSGLKSACKINGLAKLPKKQSVIGVGDFNGDGCDDLLLSTDRGAKSPDLKVKYLSAVTKKSGEINIKTKNGKVDLGSDFKKAQGVSVFKSID